MKNKHLTDLINNINPDIAAILERALESREITVEEGETLFSANGLDLLALMMAADELRRRAVGNVVTYVTVQNINFTNVCNAGCSFCAFSKKLDDAQAVLLSAAEVADIAEAAYKAGATEVCIQGGLHPHIDGSYYLDMLREIKRRTPDIHIHAFSPFEILYDAQKSGCSVSDFIKMLIDHGLGSVPGTAAEILDIEIRRQLVSKKIDTQKWVEIISTVHRLGLKSTSTIMYGHIDGPKQWAHHIGLLRDIQKETGGFTEFVPLGFMHKNAPLYLSGRARPGPTSMEDVRMHAVARIMLQGHIDNIQVSWPKLGPKFAQMCLNAGANDFGGTLMNEAITRSAGGDHGEYVSPAEFQRLIREIGRLPAQRNTTYDILQVFDGAENEPSTRK